MNTDNDILLLLELGEQLERLAPDAIEPPFAAVAWSGGADSTALLLVYLDLLHQLYGSLPSPLLAVHVDHRMRSDSVLDAEFCKNMATELGPDIELKSVYVEDGPLLADMPGSMEENARIRRYGLLGTVVRESNCRYLLSAHHADDNLETLLLALMRGSGLTGMAGVRPSIPLSELSQAPEDHSVLVVRPLLEVPRSDLERLLKGRDQQWCEDPTNRNLDFRRNRVRHELVPVLKAIADSDAPLLRTPSVLASERELVEEVTRRNLGKLMRPLPSGYARGICMSRHRLLRLSGPLLRQVLRMGIRRAGNPYAPDRNSLERLVESLADHRGGTKAFNLRGAKIDILLIWSSRLRGAAMYQEKPSPVELAVPGRASWGNFVLTAQVVELDKGTGQEWVRYLKAARSEERVGLAQPEGMPHSAMLRRRSHLELFDLDMLSTPLTVRPPEIGEVIKLFNGRTKTLSKVFIDQKVPRQSRAFVPVVQDGAGQFVWAASVVRGTAGPVTEVTTRIVKLDLLYSAT